MELVYTGKTKNVYKLPNGNYQLVFKDDVTGVNGVFDPGANHVGLQIQGAGLAALSLTQFFYTKLNGFNIPTHFVCADLDKGTMEVLPATLFGRGLEVICRFRAVGSFLRRYGAYIEEGAPLDSFVEFTLKDDNREDPPITEEALVQLGIMNREEYAAIVQLTKKIAHVVKDILAQKGLELYDIKFEFGRIGTDKNLALIDEISGGNMRAYKDGTYVDPLTVAKIILES